MNKKAAVGTLIAIAVFELFFFWVLVGDYFGASLPFDMWLLFGTKYIVLALAVAKVYDAKVLIGTLLAGVGLDIVICGLLFTSTNTSDTVYAFVIMLLAQDLQYVSALLGSAIFLAAYLGFATLRRQSVS